MPKTAQRHTFIDCAKGIGIILVVLGHYDPGTNPLCKWLSSFLMPLFFMLSGILFAINDGYANKPLRSVLKHRTTRLLYPYFTFSLLIILYNLFFGRQGAAWKALFLTITLEGNNALWFLPSLWMAECALLVLLNKRIPIRLSAIVILLGTSVYAALQYYVIGGAAPADEGLLFLILNGLCRAGVGLLFILSGYKAYLLRTRFSKLSAPSLTLTAAALFIAGFFFGYINSAPDLHYCVQGNPLLYYLSALLQSSGVILFCAAALRRNRILEFFGRNSLIIMATHYSLPIIVFVQQIIGRSFAGSRYAADLLGCALVMVIEAGVIFIINRYLPFLLRMPMSRRRS